MYALRIEQRFPPLRLPLIYHRSIIISTHYSHVNVTIQSSAPSSSFPPIRLVIVLHFPPLACIIVLMSLGGASFDSLTGYLI